MPKKTQKRITRITAHLPSSVELTKLTSGNSLNIEVRSGDELLGTLYLGRGSVQWWPSGNSSNALHKTWRQFAKILTRNMTKQ